MADEKGVRLSALSNTAMRLVQRAYWDCSKHYLCIYIRNLINMQNSTHNCTNAIKYANIGRICLAQYLPFKRTEKFIKFDYQMLIRFRRNKKNAILRRFCPWTVVFVVNVDVASNYFHLWHVKKSTDFLHACGDLASIFWA